MRTDLMVISVLAKIEGLQHVFMHRANIRDLIVLVKAKSLASLEMESVTWNPSDAFPADMTTSDIISHIVAASKDPRIDVKIWP